MKKCRCESISLPEPLRLAVAAVSEIQVRVLTAFQQHFAFLCSSTQNGISLREQTLNALSGCFAKWHIAGGRDV